MASAEQAASAFAAMRWVSELPIIRTAKGHVDRELKLVAFALALHADGETGENSYPGLDRIAREADLSSKTEARDALARGEAFGLWERDPEESEWGTTVWHLNVDDEGLIQRLEKVERERADRKRTLRAAQNARAYGRRQHQSSGADAPDSAPVDGRLRHSAPDDWCLPPSQPSDQRVSDSAPVDRYLNSAPVDPCLSTSGPMLKHQWTGTSAPVDGRLSTTQAPLTNPMNQPGVPARVQPAREPAPAAARPERPATVEDSSNQILYNFDDDDPVTPPATQRKAPATRARTSTRKPRASYDYTPDFEDAWLAYGRRGNKAKAFQEWRAALQRLESRGEEAQTILDAIAPYRASCSEERFVKHMERWLSGDGWDQEFTPAKKPYVAGSDARPHHEYVDNLKNKPIKTLLKHSIGNHPDIARTWYYYWNHEQQRDWTVEQIQEQVLVEEDARWLHHAYRHGIDQALWDRLAKYVTLD